MVAFRATTLLTLLMAVASTAGHAQVAVGGAVGFVGGTPFSGLTNLPYTATRKVTTVQKLANGATITHTSTSKEARDSQGRTMTESKPLERGDITPALDFTHVTVVDPVAHTWIIWNSQGKQATLMHMAEPRQLASASRPAVPPVLLGTAGNANTETTMIPRTAAQPRTRRDVHTEKLGGKLVGNVYAEGVRVTTTTPTGMIGNDQPLVTVAETWTAPDLKLVVLRTMDDPRTGLRTEELTDISRNEPSPTLFQVPAGYTIKEQSPNQP
jgi:hypothetical protein